MAVEMYVSKETIRGFLSSGKTFLIPEYQRAYSWKEEQCEALWNDIVDFFENSKVNDDDEYFLGSIVGFINDTERSKRNIFEVIDGQQRITTLNILFRAFYEIVGKLQNKEEITKGYIKVFGKCLWSYDDGSETFNYDERYLKSEVILDDDLKDLENILSENYDLNKDSKKSLYSKNFSFFYDRIEKYLSTLDRKKDFYEVILNRIVILPIECKSKENAMRIFTTLNNRGLPLADSDIIKGKIYAFKKKDKKSKFANEWKELESRLKNNEKNLTMDFLFIQYSHVTRARNKDSDKEIGLRRFYTDKYKGVLEKENLLEELNELASLWLGEYDDKISLNSMQMFDVLKYYPNEYWKYLLSAYYFYCKDEEIDFFDDKYLLSFLRKIVTMLLVLFIDKPTANVVKDPVFKLYANFANLSGNKKDESIQKILDNEDNSFRKKLSEVDRLTKALLKLYLYLKYPEHEIIPEAEIEHIFPKKWQDTNYNNWDRKDAEKFLEQIGNKMWLEKKLNIQAGNGYFGKKKEKYKVSKFLEARELAQFSKDNWSKSDIGDRTTEIYQRLKQFFEENL